MSKPQEPQPVPTYRNRLICYSDGRPEMAPADGWCQSGVPLTPRTDCEQLAVLPTWRQWTYPDGTTGDWELLDQGSCEPVLPVLTVEDFRSLPIPAPVLRLQPDRGWVLVNIETIVMTDPTPVALRTTLAGFGVDVEAVPTRYSYDFGDGHTLDTRSPGAPHPDHDTFHEYEQPGTYAITLTTEWSGRYRVDGDPTWRDVTGTATTSATSPPFTAEERTSRLVDSLCTDVPTPPDC
ncbi:PKD domain-containing protein [Cellulomonas flavigena]|uniref:PKD domain-containing protein n=1 Tax=Cellulomonas flavigena TaxID=1711 RepID=UPI00019E3E47|nr:PKD domain-containing protein [Cellulomonas flavigena]